MPTGAPVSIHGVVAPVHGPEGAVFTDVARAWLLARLACVPLEQAPEMVTKHWVQQAPAICAAVMGAIEAPGDDPLPGGALVELVGPDPAGLARAAEALRVAVTAETRRDADSAAHAGVTDRVAAVVAALLVDALALGRAPGEPAPGAIAVIDARRAPDPRGALTTEADRLIAVGSAFALLAIEVQDAAHLAPAALARAEAAVLSALPPGARHAPDGPGSLLVLVPGADGGTVARTVTQAVEHAGAPHGVPLRAAAGVAQHPAHGQTPSALLAHADALLFAARADGLPLVER